IWQGLQQYTIYNTEDCCVGADPDGQGENRRGGEARIPAQRAQGKTNVARDFFEERERVHAVHLLRHIRYVANLAAGRRLGARQIHAAPDVFLRLHLDVKLDLFIDTLAQLPPPEHGGESRNQGTELRHVDPPYPALPSTRAMNAAICSQFFASSANRFRPCLVME